MALSSSSEAPSVLFAYLPRADDVSRDEAREVDNVVLLQNLELEHYLFYVRYSSIKRTSKMTSERDLEILERDFIFAANIEDIGEESKLFFWAYGTSSLLNDFRALGGSLLD
jgi:hypothetical protein